MHDISYGKSEKDKHKQDPCIYKRGRKNEKAEYLKEQKGSDGYKFTCLYVLKNTPLEKLYYDNEVEILEMEEYFDIVEEAIGMLPEYAVIHRFTGDGPKKSLIAPLWTMNKRQVINYINRRFGL